MTQTLPFRKMSVGGLDLPPGKIKLTKLGATLAEDLTFEEYLQIGEALTLVGEAWQWWWGDFLNQGEHRFGEKYAQAVDDTGFAVGTLTNIASVAGRIEMARRVETLSFSHHTAVAYIDEPAVQDRLLKEASENVWSVSRLREAVTAYKDALAGKEAKKKKERAEADAAEAREKYGDDPAAEVSITEELERANATIARLEAQIASLTADDEKAEMQKLQVRIEGLEGRLAGEQREKREALRQVKYYQRLTADVRNLLGAEQNSEIKSKIQALL